MQSSKKIHAWTQMQVLLSEFLGYIGFTGKVLRAGFLANTWHLFTHPM